jgi:RNA polymerase sigma-70 factor (ECF subfamily)
MIAIWRHPWLNRAATRRAGGVRGNTKWKLTGAWSAHHQLFYPWRVLVHKGTDIELVERYRRGDRAAFTELVIRYQKPLFNVAFWTLRRVEDANDVTQEVFLKVAERLNEYDPQFKFFSWIYRIAVNESLNMLRRNRREETLDEGHDLPAEDSANPERQVGDAQLSGRIRGALMHMPADDRMVLSLRHFSECSYQQIGQILQVDEKTVKSRLFEARQRLRGMLGELRGEWK